MTTAELHENQRQALIETLASCFKVAMEEIKDLDDLPKWKGNAFAYILDHFPAVSLLVVQWEEEGRFDINDVEAAFVQAFKATIERWRDELNYRPIRTTARP